MKIIEILMSEKNSSVLSMITGNTNIGEFKDVPFTTIVRTRKDKDAHFHSECYLSLNNFQMDSLEDDVFMQQYKNMQITYAVEGQKLVNKLVSEKETDYDYKVVWLPMEELEEIV